MPLSSSEIKINTTSCNTLPKLANEARSTIEKIIKSGALYRFKLFSPLVAGSSATASIMKFDGSGFSQDKTGTVHDEDGVWSGDVDAEGWCQPRDNQDGHYSIIIMPDVIDGGRRWCQLLAGVGSCGTGGASPAWSTIRQSGGFTLDLGSYELTVPVSGYYQHQLVVYRMQPTSSSGSLPDATNPEELAVDLFGLESADQWVESCYLFTQKTATLSGISHVTPADPVSVLVFPANYTYFTGCTWVSADFSINLVEAT